jgi:hypothetical protein
MPTNMLEHVLDISLQFIRSLKAWSKEHPLGRLVRLVDGGGFSGAGWKGCGTV